jgi:Ca2+-binding RTX toxin-like protein
VLTLLGLFGVLMAGVAADAVMSPDTHSDKDNAEEDPAEDAEVVVYEEVAPAETDGFALSDDIDDEEDPKDLDLIGTDQAEVLSGGLGHDAISGLAGSDLIDGRAGDDSIDAGDGNDAVWGGTGDDTITGGLGNDTLEGQAGDDSLTGAAGNDSLAGHSGADSLAGGDGVDTLLGGEGNDQLEGGTGNDWLAGGLGDDRLAAGAGSDILDGNAGNDWLSGLDGEVDDFNEDFLNGGDGNDTLVLGAGDHATGGEGDDDFVLQDWLTDGGVAHISDYDADRDQLIIMYDPAAHPDPALTLETSDDGGQSTILLDGSPVATVQGSAVRLDDIRLSAA